jgi:hypothetical protein
LDGLRISKSTRIQHLLTFQEFYLRINDSFYKFDQDPAFVGFGSQDKVKTFGDVQSKVRENLIIFKINYPFYQIASLYTVFNVDEYKIKRENALLFNLEAVERELRPLLIVKKLI